jgi:hypothetical protein
MSTSDTITIRIFYLRCGDTLSRDLTIIFPIGRNADTSHAVLTVTTSSVALGTPTKADVGLSGLPPAADVEQFDLYLTYNHDVLTYDHTDLTGTLIVTWPLPKIVSGVATDTLHFTSLAPLTAVSGILAHLWFKTFVADSSYSPITVSISLFGTNANCPIVFGSPQASALFLGKDLCSDTLLRDALLGQPIAIDRAEIANDGNLHVVLQWLAANVNLSLTDILGRTLWNGSINCTAGITDRELALPQNLPSGPLLLRVMDGQHVRSKELMLVK